MMLRYFTDTFQLHLLLTGEMTILNFQVLYRSFGTVYKRCIFYLNSLFLNKKLPV